MAPPPERNKMIEIPDISIMIIGFLGKLFGGIVGGINNFLGSDARKILGLGTLGASETVLAPTELAINQIAPQQQKQQSTSAPGTARGGSGTSGSKSIPHLSAIPHAKEFREAIK